MDTEDGIAFLQIENLLAVPGHGSRYPTDARQMLSLLLCLIATIPPTSSGRPAAEAAADEAGLSHLLALKLTYSDLPEPRFVATLENRSGTELEIVGRFAELHGTFHVVANDGTETNLCMPCYRTLLLTSTWFDPSNKMPADTIHHWTVGLDQLVDLHGKRVFKHQLQGKKVFLTIPRIAIVPHGLKTPFVASNAMQQSRAIRIPDGG